MCWTSLCFLQTCLLSLVLLPDEQLLFTTLLARLQLREAREREPVPMDSSHRDRALFEIGKIEKEKNESREYRIQIIVQYLLEPDTVRMDCWYFHHSEKGR